MRHPALGDEVAQLPWLSPCATSLLALAHSPAPAVWSQLRGDPGAVLLVARQATSAPNAPVRPTLPALLHDPAVAESAVRHLEHSSPAFVDWDSPAVRPVYQAGLAIARMAHRLAVRCERCDPEEAWAAGLLASLGWLAVCAADPGRVEACLADPALPRRPARTQQRHWGLDHAAIARRLARSWQLPAWLSGVLGRLGLPVEVAAAPDADQDLCRVVQLAVALAQRPGVSLHLTVGTGPAENAAALGLPAGEVEVLEREAAGPDIQAVPARAWHPPAGQPLLRELLALAAENLRLRGTTPLACLQRELDDLHQALEEQHAGEAERLQARKLAALAEFAAGAGHEINNPLAVISGQAQYVLKQLQMANGKGQMVAAKGSPDGENEPPGCNLHAAIANSQRTIIDQCQRIHGILRDLWQFARPPEPSKEPVDLPDLINEVGAALSDLAAQRKVELRYKGPLVDGVAVARPQGLTVLADPGQLRTALSCLLRNAIEAAPADGWAGVRVEAPATDHVNVLVEDNGTPPPLPLREHLFDPFYSGRPAGRGRGLGLPTAWRLARAHGGDVRFVGLPGEPTRFVLSLPRANGRPNEER